MNMKNQWLFEVPFSLSETDHMARLSDNLHKEQRRDLRNLALQIAERMAHRKQSGQSSAGRHEAGIARKAQDITSSAMMAIDRGTSYGQVMNGLKNLLQSLINRQTKKKFNLKQ
jgi:hypothetical protein